MRRLIARAILATIGGAFFTGLVAMAITDTIHIPYFWALPIAMVFVAIVTWAAYEVSKDF